MATLTKASKQLFGRSEDEFVSDLDTLTRLTLAQKSGGKDRWQLPQTIRPVRHGDVVGLDLGADGSFGLNDWSFSQLCKMAAVSKDTVNKLAPQTAAQVFLETLPVGKKPTQVLTEGGVIRSIHGTNYSRLWNHDLIEGVRDATGDTFSHPRRGCNGATGLYLGEQDMFAFLIDPDGWVEIDGEAFAPGFFVWNSEVGRRSVGIQTFFFQQVCTNHIVWDAIEVEEATWTHTAKVDEAIPVIKAMVGQLAKRRNDLRDSFARVLRRAVETELGADADDVLKALAKHGIPAGLGRLACELCEKTGKRFTIFSMVDALTQMNRESKFAGERTEADIRAASLLKIVTTKEDRVFLPIAV